MKVFFRVMLKGWFFALECAFFPPHMDYYHGQHLSNIVHSSTFFILTVTIPTTISIYWHFLNRKNSAPLGAFTKVYLINSDMTQK